MVENFPYPTWQKPYLYAVAELDAKKLRDRVAAAERAIALRMEQVSEDTDELRAMQAAREVLSTLFSSIPKS